MAKRRKSDAAPDGTGSGEGADVVEGAGLDDPTAFDEIPTRPGVVVDITEEKTDPGTRAAEFAAALEASAADEVPPAAAEVGGAQILDFSSGRADAGQAADDDVRPPTDATLGDAAGQAGAEAEGEEIERVAFEELEPLIEALLFASDKPLAIADLKRLTGETDARLINQALEALIERRKGGGVQILSVAGAYSFRTNPKFADWVSRLIAGKPVRLSRALLETLAIVAYRQPITRPEMDDIRGVDCGPVLKTLLDRNLVRIIGKKEEVGRPMLYGTTPEFLRIFSLKDLTQLPTLRQFHELSAEHQAKVDENHPPSVDAAVGIIGGGAPLEALSPPALSPEPGEDDRLIADLEEASAAATRAAGPLSPEAPPPEGEGAGDPAPGKPSA
jgi:segregation and condensation protein B